MEHSTRQIVRHTSRASWLLAAFVVGGVLWTEASQAAMSYLDNGVVKVGVDLAKGGSITYLSVSGTSANVINSYDLGRWTNIQQSNRVSWVLDV